MKNEGRGGRVRGGDRGQDRLVKSKARKMRKEILRFPNPSS
jgi:hypothetical protein